jgi:hypothetical protein
MKGRACDDESSLDLLSLLLEGALPKFGCLGNG